MRATPALGLACGLFTACGPHATRVTGTVEGHALTSATAGSVSASYVVIGDLPNACDATIVTYAPKKGASVIRMNLFTLDFNAHPVPVKGSPGGYTVVLPNQGMPNQRVAQVTFDLYDDQCRRASSINGTSGTVTLDSVGSDNVAQGTFDLHFGADHLTGSFTAPPCGPPRDMTICN